MTAYGITFLGDDDPLISDGQNFVLVADQAGSWIFYRESAICPTVLEESWEAYRALLAKDGDDDPEGEPVEPEDCADCSSEMTEIDRRRHRWEHAVRGDLRAVI